MNNIFGGGDNLPPGCSVNDIPGCRPEDEAREKLAEGFWSDKNNCPDELWQKFQDADLDGDLCFVVDNAIQFGIATVEANDE